MVGELIGEGDARERGVVGDTPNLAARLQAWPSPAASWSPTRRDGCSAGLRAESARATGAEGLRAPVPAWSVVREIENVSRFEASRSEALTPFVGREHEIALLIDRWHNATEGEGQVALLSGEAGIGKSRVLAALRERIGGERHIVCAINARRIVSTTRSIR